MSKKVLWKHRNSSRAFLIPKGFVLAGGSFEIHNTEDHSIMVDENSILEYEASEEEVEAFENETINNELNDIVVPPVTRTSFNAPLSTTNRVRLFHYSDSDLERSEAEPQGGRGRHNHAQLQGTF